MECPYCSFPSHSWALDLPGPFNVLFSDWDEVLHIILPLPTVQHRVPGWKNPQVFQTRSPRTIPSPKKLSKKYSVPGRRNHPATFQDIVFLFSQSKGLGKIYELQWNKYFPSQSSPGQRGYKPTRIETKTVSHFMRIHVLEESVEMLKLKVDVEHKVTWE